MIYTKTGDGGVTSLVGGTRVSKDDVRVEAYGTIDELNSHVGLLAELVRHTMPEEYAMLKSVQHDLFTIQTLVATEDSQLLDKLPQITDDDVLGIEKQIDRIISQLPKLRNFVVAGGTVSGAQAHVARTVCRRAERRLVTLSKAAKIDERLMRYINRLSDLLFVLSRLIVVNQGEAENLYIN